MSKPQEYYVYNPRDARAGINSKCIMWWRHDGMGYARDLRRAGKFTEEHRQKWEGKDLVFVPCEIAHSNALMELLVHVDELPIEYRPKKGQKR